MGIGARRHTIDIVNKYFSAKRKNRRVGGWSCALAGQRAWRWCVVGSGYSDQNKYIRHLQTKACDVVQRYSSSAPEPAAMPPFSCRTQNRQTGDAPGGNACIVRWGSLHPPHHARYRDLSLSGGYGIRPYKFKRVVFQISTALDFCPRERRGPGEALGGAMGAPPVAEKAT